MSGVLGLVICFPKKNARLLDHPYMLTAVEGRCKALGQTKTNTILSRNTFFDSKIEFNFISI